ncbi:MCP four helix bundle domain-containing protein [Chitinibacter bivalviorum]|uniref:MCP four helix bundle domain-containing protein n=1 Tax=Chitinibacter bivalviorum TaxID=2739434 RepID=A0A7H9BLY5_9NEIS|nr:methyl-accepting chemotaxis protein [Chitinibacter bivalviorum]QLG89396.1 MCP four helix bundle domain-containing protein [Chitinibacter bivalviorum]
MKLTIQSRLIYTIAFMAILLIGIGGLGISNLSKINDSLKTVYEDRVVPLKQLKMIADDYAVSVIDAVNKANAGLIEAEPTLAKVRKASAEIDQEWKKYKATTLTPDESKLAEQAEVLFAKANRDVAQLDAFLATKHGNIQGDLIQFDGPLYTSIDPIGDKIGELITLQLDVAKAEFIASQKTYETVRTVSLGLILLGLVLAVLSGVLLIRAISRPLSSAVTVAQNIAQGRLDNQIVIHSQDETGQLLLAMQQMQQSIQSFVAAQQQMAQQQAAGAMSARLDASQYPGTFGVMAGQVNTLVEEQNRVIQTTIEVIAQYSKGNFTPDMPALPGEKAKITQSIAEVKRALLAISGDIQRLAQAGANGDFSQRCDASQYQYMFQAMLENLNQLIVTCDVGFNDVLRVSEALAQGDLSQTISKDYPGLFGRTKHGVNATVASLSKIIGEVDQMVSAAAERGDFSRRLSTEDKQGFSRNLAEQLNQLSSTTDTGLRDVMRVATALADGDLTQSITKNYPGLFGETGEAVNTTVKNLQHLVGEIQQSGTTISHAASEIAQGNADLSRRTESQAANLEETAASTEELTGTVRQNAENAREANELAQSSAKITHEGAIAVRNIVERMNSIQAASSKIVEIISVIDGIAFQTNILALNAAVEAARAGEQGRGFAVVASEVRNLAQRSAVAAKEIKVLIGDSVAQVEQGSLQVNQAGNTMGQVENSIERVSVLIAEIANASIEQSAGIAQVNQAVTQMDEVTQQNAALVEQAAAAAESLQEQAQALSDAVSVFKINQATPMTVQKVIHKAAQLEPADQSGHQNNALSVI